MANDDDGDFPELDKLDWGVKCKFEYMAGLINGYAETEARLTEKNRELLEDNTKLANHVIRLLEEKEHGQG